MRQTSRKAKSELLSTIMAMNRCMVSIAHELPNLFFIKRYCKRKHKMKKMYPVRTQGRGCCVRALLKSFQTAVEMVLSSGDLKCFPDCDVCDAEDRSTGPVPPSEYIPVMREL